MDPFNALSSVATVRMIPPLREAPPAKVTSCTKEAIGGAGMPSRMMGGRPTDHCWWMIDPPSRWVSRHLCARVPLLPRTVVRVLSMRFPLVR
jgi:hypothetical protein